MHLTNYGYFDHMKDPNTPNFLAEYPKLSREENGADLWNSGLNLWPTYQGQSYEAWSAWKWVILLITALSSSTVQQL